MGLDLFFQPATHTSQKAYTYYSNQPFVSLKVSTPILYWFTGSLFVSPAKKVERSILIYTLYNNIAVGLSYLPAELSPCLQAVSSV